MARHDSAQASAESSVTFSYEVAPTKRQASMDHQFLAVTGAVLWIPSLVVIGALSEAGVVGNFGFPLVVLSLGVFPYAGMAFDVDDSLLWLTIWALATIALFAWAIAA